MGLVCVVMIVTVAAMTKRRELRNLQTIASNDLRIRNMHLWSWVKRVAVVYTCTHSHTMCELYAMELIIMSCCFGT